MKKFLHLLLALIILSGCSVIRKANKKEDIINFQELNYGIVIATGEYTKADIKSPSGKHSFSSDYILLEKTDTIKAKVGTRFGVQYMLKSNIDKWIPIRHVWTYPKDIIDNENNKFKNLVYTIEKPTNIERWSNYKIDTENELVKGLWIFQVYYNNKKLYEKKFYIE